MDFSGFFGELLAGIISLYFIKKGWVYCYDPYQVKSNGSNKWEWINPSENEGCNIKVKQSHFNKKESNEKFHAGQMIDRQFVLIERKQIKNINY
ncbi:hypothetical protein [uncultured Fibrobacter sp.]|uniref:hypothetical protein n=1 Tax=uncultured Fibrobacter sp. TaxID=261512 RepID=UPI002806592C|nr:hypothetical protein [uncultured Fibrobacter sp.]